MHRPWLILATLFLLLLFLLISFWTMFPSPCVALFWWMVGPEENGKTGGGLGRENSLLCLLSVPVALATNYRLARRTSQPHLDLCAQVPDLYQNGFSRCVLIPTLFWDTLIFWSKKDSHLQETGSMIWPNLIFPWIWVCFYFPLHKGKKEKGKKREKENGRKAHVPFLCCHLKQPNGEPIYSA